MNYFDHCSIRLQLDLITLLVTFACELGQIITRYDFTGASRVTLILVDSRENRIWIDRWE